jgi:RHS repeat-associated protein
MADERTGLDTSGNVVSQEVLWALTDQQGSVRDLAKFDATSGATAVVDHVIYGAFGGVTSESNPSEGCLFKYTGRPTDNATGIENHLNRVKLAGSSDWTSEDPKGLAAGQTNIRDYCGNSPTNATDPSGLFWYYPATLTADQVETLQAAEAEAKRRVALWVTFLNPGPTQLDITDFLQNNGLPPGETGQNVTLISTFTLTLRRNFKAIAEALNSSSYVLAGATLPADVDAQTVRPWRIKKWFGAEDHIDFNLQRYFRDNPSLRAAVFVHELCHYCCFTYDDYSWTHATKAVVENANVAQLYEQAALCTDAASVSAQYWDWVREAERDAQGK